MGKYETVCRFKNYSASGKLVSTMYSVPYGEFNTKKEADLFTNAKREDDKPQERLNKILKNEIKNKKLKSACSIEEWITRKKPTAKPKATAKKATKPAPKKSTAKKTPAKGKTKTARRK